MTEHKNQAHFCQETIQHSIVIMHLLCLLRSHSDLDTSPALPSSQWSAGPWAQPVSASLWDRAGPDHLHPPWVGPPKLAISLRQAHSWGRREVIPGWRASPAVLEEETALSAAQTLTLLSTSHSACATAASIKCCFDSLKWGTPFLMKEFKLYPLTQKLPRSHSASANLSSLPTL